MFDWFAFPDLGIYSKGTLDENGQDLRKLAFAPGTGPFGVSQHLPGETWIIDANSDHWNPNVPYVDRLEMIQAPSSVDRGGSNRSGLLVMECGLPDLGRGHD